MVHGKYSVTSIAEHHGYFVVALTVLAHACKVVLGVWASSASWDARIGGWEDLKASSSTGAGLPQYWRSCERHESAGARTCEAHGSSDEMIGREGNKTMYDEDDAPGLSRGFPFLGKERQTVPGNAK